MTMDFGVRSEMRSLTRMKSWAGAGRSGRGGGGGPGGVVGEVPAVGPLDGRAGHAVVALVHEEGGAGEFFPLGGEAGGDGGGESYAGVGGPGAGGAGAAGEGRAVFRVDGDFGAGTLKHGGGGEADGSGTEDGDVVGALGGGHGGLGGDGGRSPGERPAAAAVAVVVDDGLGAELFDVAAGSGGAEGTGADGDTEDAVGVSSERDQGGVTVVERKRGRAGNCGSGGFASGHSESAEATEASEG